jgi:multiple sugar transport system substrate-binding protein
MICKASVRGAALLAVAAMALAGCGDSGSGDSSGGQSGALEGRGPIKFATGKDTSGNMQKLVDEWNTKHADQKVTITELPESADDQRDALVRNAQAQSKEYTILNLDVVWTAEFAANQWVVQLPEDQFDLENFLEPAANTAKYRDKLYAVPVYSDGGLLYYRKDLLTAAGITNAPKTWDEMQADCTKVKGLPGNEGLGCYAGQFDKYEGLTCNFSEAVQSAGGSVLDKEGKPTVDTKEAKDGLSFLADGLKNGEIPQAAVTYQEEDGRRAFQDGTLIFHRNWPYVYAKATATDGSSKVNGKFDIAPLPGKSGPGVSTLGGHNFAISKFAENKATALDFIKFFTSEDAERSNLLATSQAPTRANLYDDADLIKQFPYLTTLKESILNAVPRPQAVKYNEVTAAIQEAAYSAMNGKSSVDDALKDLQSKLESLTTQ